MSPFICKVWNKTGIALICITGGLWFGEVHPFSSYPMYNTFPNWAYAFYFTDEKGAMIPCSTFHTSGNELGHLYNAVCASKQIAYGNESETEEQLRVIGEEMMWRLQQKNAAGVPARYSSVRLCRISFRYNDSAQLVKTNKVLCEKHP